MTVGPDQQPWVPVSPASTTSAAGGGKIKRPRRAGERGRPKAGPHPLATRYGPRTPVTLTLVLRTGADVWMEVRTGEGRFFIPFDASVFELVKLVIAGGYFIEPHSTITRSEHQRGVQGLQ